MKDLNIISETSKVPQEKIGRTPDVIGLGEYFLNGTPIGQEIKARINKWDYIKLKSFYNC
jgi:hypothetical protein